EGEQVILGIPMEQPGVMEPVIAVGDEFLILASDADTALAALAAPGGENLAGSEAFTSSREMMKQSNVAFGYLASNSVFSKTYDTLRPVLLFSAAMMPDVTEYADLSKLPETDSIARHLEPIVF